MANYKNNNYKKEDKIHQVTKTISLGKSTYYAGEEEFSSLLDTLSLIRFDKISVALMVSKKTLFDNEEAKGYMPVGWVISMGNNDFKCSINPKYADKIGDDFVVIPRCRKVNGSIEYIISLGLEAGEAVDTIGEDFFNSDESTTEQTETAE